MNDQKDIVRRIMTSGHTDLIKAVVAWADHRLAIDRSELSETEHSIIDALNFIVPGEFTPPKEDLALALFRATTQTRVTADPPHDGEVYIKTGDAEGITVKPLRRGR